MNMQFIDKLRNISQSELNNALESTKFIVIGTSLYYILFGGVLSLSNMLGSILRKGFSEDSRVKITLISGIVFLSALIKTLYHEHLTSFQPFDTQKYTENTSPLRLIIAGLLVGFGSQYAAKNSNHTFGLDGLPSFNLKSIIGHIFALVAACLTHTCALHQYLPDTPRIMDIKLPDNITYTAYLLVFILIPFICFVISSKKSFKSNFLYQIQALIAHLSLFFIGIFFGYGLMLGGLTQRKVIYSFLILDKKFNPELIVIYGVAFVVSFIVYLVMKYLLYFFIYQSKKPVFGSQLIKDNSSIKLNLLIGAIIFGIGWGLGGLKPASVLLLMPLESIKIVFYWGLSCLIGMKAAHKLFDSKVNELITPEKAQ